MNEERAMGEIASIERDLIRHAAIATAAAGRAALVLDRMGETSKADGAWAAADREGSRFLKLWGAALCDS